MPRALATGISMILFAGILSRGGSAVLKMWQYFQMGAQSTKYYFYVPLVLILFLAMIVFIVVMTSAERRIPVQYAKRVVGRKLYGGQSTFMPIKVNMVRRSADHLCQLYSGDPRYHQGVCAAEHRGLAV